MRCFLWAVVGLCPLFVPHCFADEDGTRLAPVFAQKVDRRLDVPVSEQSTYADLLTRNLNAASMTNPQYVVIVDRNIWVQALLIYWMSADRVFHFIGASPVSTGNPGRFEHFVTPTGVFEHTLDNRDFRAKGTPNELGFRGFGAKGMRVYDFGWQDAIRGWDHYSPGKVRLEMHATDPDRLARKLGTPQSEGCIRIPAALSGLVGYRASHALPSKWIGQWSGGVHLSQSFDTLGFFVRDPRDVPPIAEALFHIPKGVAPKKPRIGCIELKFASDANPECLAAYAAWKQTLKEAGAKLIDFDPVGWQSTTEIYAGIQASEAAAIHRRHFDKLLPTLDPAIAKRLQWGASLTEDDIESLRSRHAYFRLAIATLLAQFDFLLVPSAPVNKLPVGEDYTAARNAILRYSTPFSLSGLPVITLPGELIGAPMGTGVQLAAPQLEDGNLIAYAAGLPI